MSYLWGSYQAYLVSIDSSFVYFRYFLYYLKMDDGLTDLERLQAKANAVTDGSLESTRRMMAMVEDVSI